MTIFSACWFHLQAWKMMIHVAARKAAELHDKVAKLKNVMRAFLPCFKLSFPLRKNCIWTTFWPVIVHQVTNVTFLISWN